MGFSKKDSSHLFFSEIIFFSILYGKGPVAFLSTKMCAYLAWPYVYVFM